MHELTVPAPELISRAVSARAAAVALRVAGLLEDGCSDLSGAPEAVRFLRTWAASVAASTTVAPPRQPLDLLATRYGLGEAECALVLLAGLPEEHEGLAGTFRQM